MKPREATEILGQALRWLTTSSETYSLIPKGRNTSLRITAHSFDAVPAAMGICLAWSLLFSPRKKLLGFSPFVIVNYSRPKTYGDFVPLMEPKHPIDPTIGIVATPVIDVARLARIHAADPKRLERMARNAQTVVNDYGYPIGT